MTSSRPKTWGLQEFKGGVGVKVLGIGDNVVDKYLNLGLMFPGGNALNVAVFAHRYGADAAVC